MIRLFSFLVVLMLAVPALAASPTILMEDLHATASAAVSAPGQGRRQIISGSECYPGGTGVCAKVTLTMGPEGHYTAYEPWTLDITDSSEITIVYYEKMNPFPTWVGGGIKSHRPYFYNTGGEATQGWLKPYFGHPYNFHCNEVCGTYMNAFSEGYITYGSRVTQYNRYACPGGHCVPHGGDATAGIGNAAFANLNGDGINGFGTGWRKIRNYIKMPSNNSTADGRNTYWIDEEMIYDVTNVSITYMENNNNKIYKIIFSPQDDSGVAFSHYYDEITIYSGYVGPAGYVLLSPSPSLSPPARLRLTPPAQ